MLRTLSSPARPDRRHADVRLLIDADHYEELISRELPRARVALWIATANLKELRVEAPIGSRARARGRYVSVLDTIGGLVDANVEVRILHGCAPSRPFQEELRSRPRLMSALKLRQCPRVHMKTVIIDGGLLYLGSANFTGAGLGARSDGRRNFELGILSDDEHLLDATQARFDAIWSGSECGACRLRAKCPTPIDTLDASPSGKRGR